MTTTLIWLDDEETTRCQGQQPDYNNRSGSFCIRIHATSETVLEIYVTEKCNKWLWCLRWMAVLPVLVFCYCIKFFTGINLLITINCLTCYHVRTSTRTIQGGEASASAEATLSWVQCTIQGGEASASAEATLSRVQCTFPRAEEVCMNCVAWSSQPY